MTTSSSSSVRRLDLPRVFAALFRPRTAFADMASESRASWWTPMLILSITALLVILVAGYFKTQAAQMGEFTPPLGWEWWSPEWQENYMQAQQARQGPAFMYVIPLVGAWSGLWLGWLVLAGILHLGSTLLGGRGSMQSALNLVAWGSLPFAIRDILRAIFMLSAGHTIVSPGLSGFANSAGFLAQLLARTDVFLIWSIVLLVIGLAALDGLPRGKAFVAVFVVMLIVLSAQAGFSALISGLGGGGGIQRPYF